MRWRTEPAMPDLNWSRRQRARPSPRRRRSCDSRTAKSANGGQHYFCAASIFTELRRGHEFEDFKRLSGIDGRPPGVEELRNGELEPLVALRRGCIGRSVVANDPEHRELVGFVPRYAVVRTNA